MLYVYQRIVLAWMRALIGHPPSPMPSTQVFPMSQVESDTVGLYAPREIDCVEAWAYSDSNKRPAWVDNAFDDGVLLRDTDSLTLFTTDAGVDGFETCPITSGPIVYRYTDSPELWLTDVIEFHKRFRKITTDRYDVPTTLIV